MAHLASTYVQFQYEQYLYATLDGTLAIIELHQAINLPTPIYTPGRRETLQGLSALSKNTTQYSWPGLEPAPLNVEFSTRPLYFPHHYTGAVT